MKTRALRKGDLVLVTQRYDSAPRESKVRGTVSQVGRHMIRVHFPINKYAWVPKELCDLDRDKS
jgi:hypothetical protein